MKRLFLFLAFIAVGLLTSAQYFQTGQDPASIRWRQINTQNFQIIYPDYYEAQAQTLAAKLDAVYVYGSFTLKHNPAKIPVILHTQTVQSNGLVAWAPKRAEFYTTPHQSMYPQDWLEQLALHEFRHVVQIDKIHQNLPAWAKFLLGEQGTALAFGAYLPFWWIEGDAVVAETALSNYGRGRHPSFLMEHRAQVLDKGVFSYEKAFFRSYRDFVPNHYKLGYYLTGAIRARHGSEIWEEVLTRAGRKPLSIFPMRQVLKERTGLNITQNYHSVFDSLKVAWKKEDMEFEQAPFNLLSGDHRFFTSYNHNYWLNDSTLLSYKTAFDEIPSFVRREEGKREEKVFFPGYIFNESVGYRDEWIVWSEQIKDPRWEHSGRSLLRLANVNTKRRIEIKPEFKAFSPAVSPDKLKIAVVETDFSSNYYLSVYQLPDGKLLHRFQTLENNYFFTPKWLNNKEVSAIILTRNGKRLVHVNFDSDEMDFLLDAELGDIKHLRVAGGYLYFISSYSGKNSLYRLNNEDRSVEMVYEPRFGVESPAISPDGKRIVLSDYHSDGFRLIEIDANNSMIRPLNEVKQGSYPLAEALALQEPGFPVFTDTVSGDYYSSRKYRKAANLFNFHSWGPVYPDIVNYEFYPGMSFMSQNVLGTSETVLGYKYDLTESTGRFMADYSFKGWYPIFDLKLSHGPRASEYNLIEQTTDEQGRVIRQDTISRRFTWGETSTGLNIRLPLQYGKGPYNRIFQPEVQYRFNYYSHHESTPERFHSGSFHSLGYRFYIHQVLRRSYLDMFPDFGIVLDGTFRHSPAGDLRAGQIKALQSVMYLPGIMKNHGIKLYAGGQEKKTNGTVGFSDVVRYARGWGRINTTAVYTGAADYKMPLLYPDWNFWGFLYTRRIQASLFADYTRLKGNFYHAGHITGTFTKDISSMGVELTADVNMLRFYAPSTIGFRTSYLPEMKNVYFDFLFSIDFASF